MASSTLLAQLELDSAYKLNSSGTSVASAFGSPAALINLILPNVYVLAGIVVFFLLGFGGLSIIMAGGDQKGVERGTQAIKSAIIGFLVIFTSYWIVQIVEIITGVQILSSGV